MNIPRLTVTRVINPVFYNSIDLPFISENFSCPTTQYFPSGEFIEVKLGFDCYNSMEE